MPQAIRRVIPPLLNDFISLQKDTALLSTASIAEVVLTATLWQSKLFNLSPVTLAAAFFIIITIPQARFVDVLINRDAAAKGGRLMAFLEIDDVHKSFGHNEVLKGVSLDVERHEVVCLIGASGSGKSTLLRCVNALEDINGGEIRIDGDTVTGAGVDLNALRRDVGIVFQSYNLFPHMSVLQNVTLAPIGVAGLNRNEAEERGHAAPGVGGHGARRRRPIRTASPAASSSASRSSGRWPCSRG